MKVMVTVLAAIGLYAVIASALDADILLKGRGAWKVTDAVGRVGARIVYSFVGVVMIAIAACEYAVGR